MTTIEHLFDAEEVIRELADEEILGYAKEHDAVPLTAVALIDEHWKNRIGPEYAVYLQVQKLTDITEHKLLTDFYFDLTSESGNLPFTKQQPYFAWLHRYSTEHHGIESLITQSEYTGRCGLMSPALRARLLSSSFIQEFEGVANVVYTSGCVLVVPSDKSDSGFQQTFGAHLDDLICEQPSKD